MAASDKYRSICVLGCGGFIGSHLVERLLADGRYRVRGIDRASARIEHLLPDPRFDFTLADISDDRALRRAVEQSDVVVSLVALCNPSLYTTVPLDVIEANFIRPLGVVRVCADLDKWLVHFSTSEVYGKTVAGLVHGRCESGDHPQYQVFSEDTTPLVLGPVRAQRWCYASAKQLLERTLYAYGFEHGLRYTIVRPFNFIGPRMDFVPGVDGEGIPRVLACFMGALMKHEPLKLVDGGRSMRVFTHIDDAVDGVMAILDRPGQAQGQIFNLGNPQNEISIADLAETMIGLYRELRPESAEEEFGIETVSGDEFYGEGYEDCDRRVPDITKARELLGWEPKVGLRSALRKSMRAYLDHYQEAVTAREALS